MDLNTAEKHAKALMTAHGVGHLAFEFARGKNQLGACHHRGVRNMNGDIIRIPFKISLSKHYVELLGQDEIGDVILHEIAHALALGKGEKGHGHVWKQIARSIGARPERCAAPSAAPETSVKGFCRKCEQVVMQQHRLPLRVYWHAGCGHSKDDALLWFKNGTRVLADDMPARYKAEMMRPSSGRTQTRKAKPKQLEDYFKF